MYKTKIIVVVFLFLTSCAVSSRMQKDQLNIGLDEFRNIKIASLIMENDSQETTQMYSYIFPKYLVKLNMTRELCNAKLSKLDVSIRAEADKDILKNAIYVKVNNKNYAIPITDSSFDVQSGKRRDNSGNTISSYNFKYLKCKVQLQNNIFKDLNEKSSITIRFYSGEEPITIIIGPNRIDKVIKFFSAI